MVLSWQLVFLSAIHFTIYSTAVTVTQDHNVSRGLKVPTQGLAEAPSFTQQSPSRGRRHEIKTGVTRRRRRRSMRKQRHHVVLAERTSSFQASSAGQTKGRKFKSTRRRRRQSMKMQTWHTSEDVLDKGNKQLPHSLVSGRFQNEQTNEEKTNTEYRNPKLNCQYNLHLRTSESMRWIVALAWMMLWLVCMLFSSKRAVKISAFILIATLLVINASVNQLTDCSVFYGPWNMFHVQARVKSVLMNRIGMPVAVSGTLLAAFLFLRRGGCELVASKMEPSKPAISLALARVLLPMIFLGLLPGANTGLALIQGLGLPFAWMGMVPLIASLTLLLGVQARFSSLILAVFCTLTLGDKKFHHHHWNCLTLVFSIFAFTTSGSTYSLGYFLARRQKWIQGESDKQGTKGTKTQEVTDGEVDEEMKTWAHDEATTESNWAKPLITLHISLIYFWAGCDKIHLQWISGHALQFIITSRSFIGPAFIWLFPEKDHQIMIGVILTLVCILIELLIPFLLWTKDYNVYAVAIGCLMHFGMSFMCGNLGTYTLVSWLCLILSLDDDVVNSYLSNPRNFAIATLGLLLAMISSKQLETSHILMRIF